MFSILFGETVQVLELSLLQLKLLLRMQVLKDGFSKQKLLKENYFAKLAHLNLHSKEKDEFVARI